MPVVSYAIPALVAIGQARYFHAPPRNPITRLIRWLSITRSLKVLRRMQPDSGGYLEATPLTSFVVMSLASQPATPWRDRPRSESRADGHPPKASSSSPPPSAPTAVGRSTRTSPPGTPRSPSTPWPARGRRRQPTLLGSANASTGSSPASTPSVIPSPAPIPAASAGATSPARCPMRMIRRGHAGIAIVPLNGSMHGLERTGSRTAMLRCICWLMRSAKSRWRLANFLPRLGKAAV